MICTRTHLAAKLGMQAAQEDKYIRKITRVCLKEIWPKALNRALLASTIREMISHELIPLRHFQSTFLPRESQTDAICGTVIVGVAASKARARPHVTRIFLRERQVCIIVVVIPPPPRVPFRPSVDDSHRSDKRHQLL